MAGLTGSDQERLLQNLHQIPEFNHFGVAFIGGNMCQVVKSSQLPRGLQSWIVIREREIANTLVGPPADDEWNWDIAWETLNVGLACGATVAAGMASAAGVIAAPVTGGTSAVLSTVAYAGSLATAAQCGISTGRLMNEIFDPEANDILDSLEGFNTTSSILDAVSVAGGLAALGQTAQLVVRTARTTGKPISQVVKGLNRTDRKRLAQEMAKYTSDATTRKQFIRLARAGEIPKVFTRSQISDALKEQLLYLISSGLTMIGSGTSGVVKELLIYFVQDE